MASIIVLLIMAGCAAYQLFKGTFLKAFVTFMAALTASIVAFAWFEQLGEMLSNTLAGWAQPICLVILFIVVFAILQTAAMFLARQPIDLGVKPERVGRIVFGLLLGLILSGLLLTALATAPLSVSYPYQRFDPSRPFPQTPRKALLNPDGFLARCFATVSRGCLSGSKSFAVLHADFLNQLFLNRLLIDKNVAVFTDRGSITIPDKVAAWPAPDDLKDNSGAPVASKSDQDLIITRVGLTSAALKPNGMFTPGQLRLICKEKGGKQRFQGSAIDIYPVGYIKNAGQLQLTGLTNQIKLQSQDIKGKAAWIDFAFYIPNDFEPVAVGYKANIIVEVPPMVSAEQAPTPIPFIPSAACATLFVKISPATSAKIYGLELASGTKLLEGTTLAVSDRRGWTALQTERSIMPAQFERDQITCARDELQLQAPEEEPNQTSTKPKESKENKLPQMPKPAAGYIVLSLKCNLPAVGSAMRGEQLPVLIDSTEVFHHPCGLLAAGKVGDDTVFEFDYCSLNTEITLAENGAVAKPFPDTIWLTEKAQSISELYVLYMVKNNTIILSVRPAGVQTGAALEGADGFLVK